MKKGGKIVQQPAEAPSPACADDDQEALKKVLAAIEKLTPDQRQRVIATACTFYGIDPRKVENRPDRYGMSMASR